MTARWPLFAGLALALALAACDAIVGAGNRKLDTTIVCDDDGCECAFGHADCDGVADNGCETPLDEPDNCGACGNVCENGTCVDFTCTCSGTFAECDGDPLTVCETDLSTTSEHCGFCGRSCAGEPCGNGLCVPQPVGSVAPVYSFIVVGGSIYFAPVAEPGVHRMKVDGSSYGKIGSDIEFANWMIAGGTTIYWASPTAIRSTSLLTGSSTLITATTGTTWQGMVIGADKIYWGQIEGTAASPGLMRLMRTPITPGGPVEEVTVLGEGKYLHDFVATSEHVYWSDVAEIRRATHDALGAAAFLTAPAPPTYMATSTDALIFAGSTAGTYLAPLAGGTTQQLASISGYGPITADADNVYFATYVDGDQTVNLWRVSKTGGAPLKLAEDPYMVFTKIAVDGQFLYWVGGPQGHILRVAK